MSTALLKNSDTDKSAGENPVDVHSKHRDRFPEQKLPNPAELQLRRSPTGSLQLFADPLNKPAESPDPTKPEVKKQDKPDWIEISIHRCLPWMSPQGFLSLRDTEGEERAFIEDVQQLPAESAEVLRENLKVTGFTLEITRVISLKKEIELRVWRVQTNHGPRQFQTELDDFPNTLPDGTMLIKDVIGDLYTIPDASKLDKKSRKMIWGFLN